jgi:3-keto-disaccharide hydrolase
MKRLLWTLLLPLLGLAVATDSPNSQAGEKGGWVAVFNGKDLEGWKISYGGKGNAENSTWKVVDGVIVGEGEVSHLFTPRDDYVNFEAKSEIMISDKGNSGFYFRTKFGPGFPAGYEAQVNATHGDPVRTGSVYNHVKIFKQLHKPDEWFSYHLKVQGNRIWVTVNKELLYEYVDHAKTYSKGHFAYQQHNLGSVVKIRSLEVKELPAK